MQVEGLERRLRTRPFRPFRIYLTDGAAYDVRHPEMCLLGRRTAVIGLAADPASTVFDRAVDVDLFHIVRVEPADLPSPSNGEQAAS
jgi:hypothetical protein